MTVDLSGKQLALLKEAVPNLSRVALIVWPPFPLKERVITTYKKAAGDLGVSLWPVEISGPDDVEPVFAKMVMDRADGFALTLGPLLFNLRARIGASALAHRVPGICFVGEEVPYGLLMSYGQDFPDFFRQRPPMVRVHADVRGSDQDRRCRREVPQQCRRSKPYAAFDRFDLQAADRIRADSDVRFTPCRLNRSMQHQH
jgi:hypothetical protein